jgi:polar amino acid transport system substrate-binding protein
VPGITGSLLMSPMLRAACLAVWGLLLFLPATAPAKPLVWATDDTPGGHYIIGGGPEFQKKKPGIEIELYRMVAEKLGLDLVFKRFSWQQCLFLIKTNRVDGIFPASFKPERLAIGSFPMAGEKIDESRKTRNNAYYLYQLKTGPVIWNGTAFSPDHPVTIGVPEGWAIVDEAEKIFGTVIKELVNPRTPNLLVHKRLDGFICLETVFDAYLSGKAAYSGVVKTGPPIWKKPYYLMLSRNFCASQPGLSEKIWDAIRDIKQTRPYLDMVKGYIDSE